MKFAIAGGGVAGLAAALAVARAGHSAVVVERDAVTALPSPDGAFDAPRKGIPHFQQPHAFLPRGRRVLHEWAPDVLEALVHAGAHEQDISLKLTGERRAGDEDLVYLWVRRPVIEWALRRAAAAEPTVELRPGQRVTGLTRADNGTATGLALEGGEELRADVVVDAMGRYRCPAGWPRAEATTSDCGAVYYSRYFELVDGASYLEGPWLLNPRGDLGYMGFNTFRGDKRTFAIVYQTPVADHDLRVLRHDEAWMAAATAITPLDRMTSPEYARPITGVLPMGGLANVDRTARLGAPALAPAGDALCHTDPGFAYGLSFALVHAVALALASGEHDEPVDLVEAYLAAVRPEATERYALVEETDAARTRAWSGERLDVGRRDGCYPMFAFAAALAAAPHDDEVLRRTIGRIGLLDAVPVFDDDNDLHGRIERVWAALMRTPPPRPGPPRDEMLRLAGAAANSL